jgi:hypothetical protein
MAPFHESNRITKAILGPVRYSSNSKVLDMLGPQIQICTSFSRERLYSFTYYFLGVQMMVKLF